MRFRIVDPLFYEDFQAFQFVGGIECVANNHSCVEAAYSELELVTIVAIQLSHAVFDEVILLYSLNPMQGVDYVSVAVERVAKLIGNRVFLQVEIAAGDQDVWRVDAARWNDDTFAGHIDRMPLLVEHPEGGLVFIKADVKRTIKVDV